MGCFSEDQDERFRSYNKTAGWCVLLMLLIVILVPLSISNVEYNEIAFSRRRSTGTISRDRVYTTGRYSLGPDVEFVKFPASAQTVEFRQMSVWTKSSSTDAGTAMYVDATFQYQLRPDELSDLYAKVAMNFDNLIQNRAYNLIKNNATLFSADEWTTDRREIQDALQAGLNAALDGAHADCLLLQIRKVAFPPTYVSRKLAAAIQIQSNAEEEYRQTSQLIRSQTAFLVKRVENDASVVSSTAEAAAKLRLIKAEQAVQALRNEAEVYTQTATLTRAQTAFDVAEISNQAKLVTQTAAAEAHKLRALATNAANARTDAARAEGLKHVATQVGLTEQSEIMSLDYIVKLVESEGGESFVGMPATLNTAATQP